MPKLGKAARGKHRWIGVEVNGAGLSRAECESTLGEILSPISFRMFDMRSDSDSALLILKVGLDDYDSTREILEATEGVCTKTSSGKIRLVRERLDMPRPVRKR